MAGMGEPMTLQCTTTALPGVLIFTPQLHGDSRGFFLQTYHAREYAAAGLTCTFVQDNLSRSRRETIRGLHYQLQHPQAKLVSVLSGAVLDVAVDIRQGSPTFGQQVAVELSAENRKQLFIPAGFAHGFRVLTDTADFHYKCTDFYTPGDEYGLFWNDPALAIPWGPVTAPVISANDAKLPHLRDLPPANLPTYR